MISRRITEQPHEPSLCIGSKSFPICCPSLLCSKLSKELKLGGDFLLRCLSIRPERTTLARLNSAVRAHLVKVPGVMVFRHLFLFPFHGIKKTERDEPRLFALQCYTLKNAVFRFVVISVSDAERKSNLAVAHCVRRGLAPLRLFYTTRYWRRTTARRGVFAHTPPEPRAEGERHGKEYGHYNGRHLPSIIS